MAEANKAAGARFDNLDGDRDGTVDMEEIAPAKVDKKAFNRADPDKDGTLTKEEYLTIVAVRFKSADPDNDGTVSMAVTPRHVKGKHWPTCSSSRLSFHSGEIHPFGADEVIGPFDCATDLDVRAAGNSRST